MMAQTILYSLIGYMLKGYIGYDFLNEGLLSIIYGVDFIYFLISLLHFQHILQKQIPRAREMAQW